MNQPVVIYTDGGARGNPGLGGWGVWGRYHDGKEFQMNGSDPMTTNNRMELLAAINALESLPDGTFVELFTDSEYVKKGITEWITNWKARGWRTADKKPVKNQDLWERLDAAAAKHQVTWRWVRGHNGDVGNEKADALVNAAMDAQIART